MHTRGEGITLDRIQAIPLSTLTRHYAADPQRFAQMFPNDWLLWLPGRWNRPKLQAEPGETMWPPTAPTLKPSQNEDPLCFQLPKLTKDAVVALGRAPSNVIVLNDATVSRQHVLLSQDSEGTWLVALREEGKDAFVDETKVPQGSKLPVSSGNKLRVGEVVLAFYSNGDFLERLRNPA